MSDSDQKGRPSDSDGLPNGQTIEQWCRRCQAMVLPVEKGRCPRCHEFLRRNFAARKHPVNVLRRDAIKAALVKQFPPANIVEQSNREILAGAFEQLETMRPGTAEWQRLIAVVKTLTSGMRDTTSPSSNRSINPFDDVSDDELEHRLLELIAARRRARKPQPPPADTKQIPEVPHPTAD